ncbi:ribosome small subunit-dependent GTPase A [Halosquirtibacter xylanolyticus]|uniref:ribosome small subunit-dependent GTPase A n=1 Tax=Halosquirtibacter xylanolyticus TaxID=3374599 RepID=UPI00374A5B14|nr:ribosome small subunit-dependent GTPase A [Prolixibacteraceae bacterium]
MTKGLVIKSTGSWYTVKDDEGQLHLCKIKGKFRTKGIRTTNPISVGDMVYFDLVVNSTDKNEEPVGLIKKIEPRKNYIIRKSSNLSKQSQIIAANVDQAFLIVTISHPRTLTGFIDRFLVSAEAYRIPVRLVFNKLDIYNEEDYEILEDYLHIYEGAGYECFQVSAEKDFNIDKLRNKMAGKINVLSGHSGVGKSTIINKLEPGLDIKTAEISEVHQQGKHTTTFAEMHEMKNGGYIIDTPGVRGFGITDIDKKELSHYFPEIFQHSNECQFNNCSHQHEPRCAVKEAVENGDIAYTRYDSYISMMEDSDEKYR